MMTVAQMSKLTGVSVRTLHHYDQIGLLKPSQITEVGYRLYDQAALERLQMILLFRELEMPLKEIVEILNAPDFDREQVLTAQIKLLELKQQQIEDLLILAKNIKKIGIGNMDFSAFDKTKQKAYAQEAKSRWGKTKAYAEFAQKSEGRSEETEKALGAGLMGLFVKLGQMRDQAPDSEEVQAWVAELQTYITEHYYTCTKPILNGLGFMYADGGEMNQNIDKAAGEGTGAFAKQVIDIYLSRL